MSVLSKPYFHDEAAAFTHLESVLWPEGPVCPHCGSISGPKDTGVVEGLRQFTTIDGQLTRVGGAGEDAALQVQQLDGRVMSGFTAKRSLAKELATLLYEPVRLMGVGQWYRNEDAHWNLDRMLVQSYERLEDEDALVTLERLRKLDVKWPSDAGEALVSEREAGL